MINSLYIFASLPMEFVLSLARISKVRLKKVVKTNKGCCFYISAKDFIIFKAILEKHEKEFVVVKNYSIKTFFSRNIFRYGFYAGTLIAVIVLFFYSVNATRLTIDGNSLVKTNIIYDTVSSIVELPIKKKNIDRAEIIRELVALDGISNASVEVRGNTVLVKVYEELEKVEISDPNDLSPILSKYDALITRIVTYSGSAVVQKGQAVRKGDMLISPEILLEEDLTAQEKALGDIYGRVWFTKNLVFTPTIMVKQRTGKKETFNYTFFKKDEQYKGSFTDYEMEETSYLLPCIFPFKIHRRTYYETVSKEIEWDYESNKQGIIKENTYLIENTLPQDAIKLRTWYVEKRVDKNVNLDIYYEVEMKIN